MTTRANILALVLFALAQLLMGQVILLAQTSVPSGVPTEAPGSPVKVGVPDTQLTITGCAAPNAFVTFFDSNNPIGTVVADSVGRFSKNIVAQGPGLKNIKLYYTDVNNRTSSTVTKNINLGAHRITYLNILMPSTIEHEPEPVGIGDYLIFRGTTCPNALVNVKLNNNFNLAAQADKRGNWYVIADTSEFYVGKHSYEVISKVGSQVSEPSQKYQFTAVGDHDATAITPGDLFAPVITEPVDGYLTSTRNVLVRGTGPTNVQIELLVDGTLAGSVFTNSIGEWSMSFVMNNPTHEIQARACYENGCSELSNLVRVTFNGSLVECNMFFTLDVYRFYGLEPKDGLDLEIDSINGEAAYEMLIDWGDSTIEHITKLDNSPKRYHHVYSYTGNYNGVITIRDSAGCSAVAHFAVSVLQATPINYWWLLIIPFGAVTVWGVSKRISAWQKADEKPPAEPKPKRKLPLWPFPKPVFGSKDPPSLPENAEAEADDPETSKPMLKQNQKSDNKQS